MIAPDRKNQPLSLSQVRDWYGLLWVVNAETGTEGPAFVDRPRWHRNYRITRLDEDARCSRREWVKPSKYGAEWVCYRLEDRRHGDNG